MALNLLIELLFVSNIGIFLLNLLRFCHFLEAGAALKTTLLHSINRVFVVIFEEFAGQGTGFRLVFLSAWRL
jgi:hypothetical protein